MPPVTFPITLARQDGQVVLDGDLTATEGLPGAVVLNGTSAIVNADTVTHVTMDGELHTVDCVVAAPPAWMDDAGNITAAGLYVVGATISQVTAPTTPGLLIFVGCPELVELSQSVDVFTLSGVGSVTVEETISLAAGNLPFEVITTMVVPTDVSGVLGLRPFAWQLAVPG